MSVLNQMLRDLEARGVSAATVTAAPRSIAPSIAPSTAPSTAPAMALPSSLARSTGGGVRGARLRKVLWFVTAMAVIATVSFWAMLERRVSEAKRAPQPLGMQQFGNAIGLTQSTEPTPAALAATVAATVSVPSPIAAGAAPVSGDNSTALALTSATTLASNSPASADNRDAAAREVRSSTATRGAVVAGATADRARGALPAATLAPVTGSAATGKVLPSKRHALDTAAPPASAHAPGAAIDAQAPGESVIRATETDIARAADLIARGRNSEAQVVLERVLAASPQQVAARQALAALHAESGHRDRALAVLLDGAAIDAAHFAGPVAQLQFESGDTRGALTTLARIPLAQRSGQHDALAAGIAFSAGLFADAVVSYERAVRTPNAPAIWWLGLGLSYEAAGQRNDAHATFSRLANAAALPNDLRAFVNDKIAALAAPAVRADRAGSEIAAGAPAK